MVVLTNRRYLQNKKVRNQHFFTTKLHPSRCTKPSLMPDQFSFWSCPTNHSPPWAKSKKCQLRSALDLRDTVLFRTWKYDQSTSKGGGGWTQTIHLLTYTVFPEHTYDTSHTIRKFHPRRKCKSSILLQYDITLLNLDQTWLVTLRKKTRYLSLSPRMPTRARVRLRSVHQ